MTRNARIKRQARMKTESGDRRIGFQINGVDMFKREILRESEKLVIKPGMKLVYDEKLNLMVWRKDEN